jgi:hypothetical protein
MTTRFLASTMLALGLAACSTMSEVETSALANAPIPEGKARVIINRQSTALYVGSPATISLNGQNVADVGSGGRAVFDVPAGSNVLAVSAPLYPGEYKFKLDAARGQTYALEVGPRDASVGPAVLFGIIGGAIDAAANENSGMFEIRSSGQAASPPKEATANSGT